ncbi:MAG TPA: carboxymuconolactone decarboxylase family protein [Polyangia bacterium]|nr:carboxymuconolactone decarboxylase family protein [Polyangia bacterium]
MKLETKLVNATLALLVLGGAATARAEQAATPSAAAAAARADIGKTLGFVPQFFLKFPEGMLPGTWEEMKTLQMNPKTALSGRTKELIGLAVAAQVPCRYCIVGHTEFAKLNGASETEIGEAVGMAAITRHWSTFLNGIQTDETKFRAEIAKIIANVKASAGKAPAGKAVTVVDGDSALAEVTQLLGFAPEFLQRFPGAARAGAWRQMRDVQLSPATVTSGKNKELMGLAVASQVPCRFCIIAHTEFAKLNGATDAEITEAVAMAAFTRDMSTLLNGMQVDEAQFRKDVDHLVKNFSPKKEHASR